VPGEELRGEACTLAHQGEQVFGSIRQRPDAIASGGDSSSAFFVTRRPASTRD